MRKNILSLLLISVCANPQAQQDKSSEAPLLGFSSASAPTERDWERRFRDIPDPKRIHANMLQLAGHPHNVGSEAQRRNAEWLVARYKEWGWDTHIERFDVLYPTPKTRVLELLGPTPFKPKLDEAPQPGDPYSYEKATQLPGYNIYSGEGDVTAQLLYVNYGMPEDYNELERNGIHAKGTIVIARYGGGWRGLKPKLAYEHGAVGCIIYSDPADDGYVQGDVLPKGPMRPPDGVQRGSVADMTLYPGDPLTPGIGSVPGAARLKISEAKTLMHIPVLPIGYGDAQPFLAALDGRSVPPAWRGGLPLTYHFGPGPAKVHLKLEFNWDQRPVLDVIATMRGSEEPDIWIIRGNHYDGWVNGANDPISGQSALLEEARALGELAKQGWRPKRTLIYTAWDGEEPGLLGSTEWAETHADELNQHAAIYLNTDENGRGFFGAGGSHSLEELVNDAARDVTDPETNASIWKREQAMLALQVGRRAGAKHNSDPADVLRRTTLPLEAIGSGSDFAAFIDHLGIASLNLGFGGEDRSGTYHSAYDTPWFEDRFGDKDERYGRALAQVAGTVVMRAAGSDVLPYDFRALSDTVKGYASELKALHSSLIEESGTYQRNAGLGLYALVNDPRNPMLPPLAPPAPPPLDLSALDLSVAALGKAADHFEHAREQLVQISAADREKLNMELAHAERKLTSAAGLPGRPWVRHLLYAPGTLTGYGAKTIPGVREALEQGRFAEAKEQLDILSNAIADEAAYIEQIATEFTAPAR
ncbi:MAG TPA: transferrin receptor-like dimerization domain-containing protein [Bryobacteraceae bacterium]|nr:transferrin receptor-like dimerization domain-containing protein [Bryobacteraceae bacterium]